MDRGAWSMGQQKVTLELATKQQQHDAKFLKENMAKIFTAVFSG